MFKKNYHPTDTYGVNETKFLKRVDDGKHLKILRVSADVAFPPQPDADKFTLDEQLKAGVLPQQVRGYELPPKEAEVYQRLNEFMEDYDKFQTKKVEENE